MYKTKKKKGFIKMNFLKSLVGRLCAFALALFVGVVGASAAGLEIVSETAGVVTFSPSALATPIMAAVIDTVKYSALIALIFIGVYIIIKMFSGKKA